MRKCIPWLLIAFLLVTVVVGGLLWKEEDKLVDSLLARSLPQLHYQQVTLDSQHGRLALHGVTIALPGVVVAGGDVEITVDPATIVHGPIAVRKVVVGGLRLALDPARLASPDGAASAAVGLPDKVVFKDAEVRLTVDGLPHLQPLHLDGEAHHHGDGWRFRAMVKLEQGVVRGDGEIDGEIAHGRLQVADATIPALLAQAGVPSPAGLQPQGGVEGALAWHLPLATPADMDVAGELALHRVGVTLQHQPQQLGDVALKLGWQGKDGLLRLRRVEVRNSAFHWRYSLLKKGGELGASGGALPDVHWQLDHFRLVDGAGKLDLATAAGKVQLPLRVATLDAEGMSWRRLRPRKLALRGEVAGGKLDLRLKGDDVRLRLRGSAIPVLEPLLVSYTGLRAPAGTLGVRLRGEVGSRLKLFGELTMRHLALAPRIPVAGVDGSIPFALGLRALTDDDGVTHIPLAIRGTPAKPDVDIAEIISEVKKNLFNGRLDGGFHHLSIDFMAGRAILTPTGEKQMERLLQMLEQSSRARVDLRGCVGEQPAASPLGGGRRLAAARVRMVTKLLQRRLRRKVKTRVIYPALTAPSPDIDGKKDRVEVTIYPS